MQNIEENKYNKLKNLKRVLNISFYDYLSKHYSYNDVATAEDKIKQCYTIKIPLNKIINYIMEAYKTVDNNFNFVINEFVETLTDNKLFFDGFEIVKTGAEESTIDNMNLVITKHYIKYNNDEYVY
jgi:hypothetical protein